MDSPERVRLLMQKLSKSFDRAVAFFGAAFHVARLSFSSARYCMRYFFNGDDIKQLSLKL